LDPPAVVEVVRAGGRSVPVRIHVPASGEVAGILLRFDDPALADGEEFGVAVPLAGLPQLVLLHDEHVLARVDHPFELLLGEVPARHFLAGHTAGHPFNGLNRPAVDRDDLT
jgi:hypothetical protein